MKKILILLCVAVLVFMAFGMPAIAQEGSIVAPGVPATATQATDQGHPVSLSVPIKTEITAPELQAGIRSLNKTLWVYAMVMIVISSLEVLIYIVILISYGYFRRQVTKIPIHESTPTKEATT